MNDQSQIINNNQSMMMMNRNYGGCWPPQGPLPLQQQQQQQVSSLPPLPQQQQQQQLEDPSMKFQAPRSGFAVMKQRSNNNNNNWKGKKGMDKRNEIRRKEMGGGGGIGGGGGGGGGYQPPTLHELQSQNRLKARRFYPKKKFNRFAPFAPFAPRNTTSFIIRAKKSGGIASLVSPCPVTPAVLPTPIFSPSREVLVDMAKEEWGVDGYGSMKGLIRLRSSPGHEMIRSGGGGGDDDEEDEGGSSESDVEEHVEVERRLDHDLSRFEMIYPNGSEHQSNLLENRVDDQDTHIAQLEEENLTLKERLFLMEREMADLRMRLQFLESGTRGGGGGGEKEENIINNNNNNHLNNDNNNDEASDNEGGGDVCSEKSVGDGD